MLCSIWAEQCSKTQLVIGVIQFCSSFFLIGWVWALIWSFLILKNGCSSQEMTKYYTKAQSMMGDENQGLNRPQIAHMT